MGSAYSYSSPNSVRSPRAERPFWSGRSQVGAERRDGSTIIPRRFQPHLAAGFGAEDAGDGLRSFDRAMPAWMARLWGMDFIREIALVLGLVVLFAFVLERNLAFSLLQSRLATIPRYDDVGYLLDGISRLNFHLANSFGDFWSNVLASPPHAPVSTLTAMLGFALFGQEISSAYIANGWILAAYVAVLAVVSRPLASVSARLLFVATFLVAPVCHAMITEFRPDMAAGLVFAVALAAICQIDLLKAGGWARIGVAALAVAATIVKPSGAVVVIPGLGIAFLLSTVLQAQAAEVPILQLLRRALLPVAAYLVLLAPFAAVWGPQTIAYIYQALVGNADVWRTDGDWQFHWSYHLFGLGGRMALGPFKWIGLVAIAADVLLLTRAEARERAAAYSLYGTLAVLYAAMALSAEKTAFQGSLFYLPFLLAAALATVRIAIVTRAYLRPAWVPGGALAIVGLVLLATQPLASSFTPLPNYAQDMPPLLQRVSERIAEFAEQRPVGGACSGRTPILLATNPEPVTPEAVLFELAARGKPLDYRISFLARSDDEVRQAVANADLVLIPDPAVPGLDTWFPGSAFGAATLDRLKHDSAWTGERIGDIQGAPVWLFLKSACLPGVATPF
ncbi:hypothetical protein C3941_11605 [Kaistia algarum]|nr:hypothetical protein C3941_11605 [Kaistia algarum]